MSQHDRDPRRFDDEAPLTLGRYRQETGERRGGPAPVTLLVSLILLAAAGGGVFYLYRGGLRGPSGPPQPVGTPIRDVKVAAPPEAQPEDPAAGLSIYRDNGAATPAAPAFAPPPEQPMPRPTPPAPPPVSAPLREAPLPATPLATPSVVAPVKPAVKSAPKPGAAGPATIADALAAAPSAATPSVKASDPSAKSAAKAAAKSATAKSAVPPPGGYSVQIGAFSSSNLAEKGWSADAAVAPGAMLGKGKSVEKIAKDDATLYRTSITGFATREEARALCAQLQAAGKTCFVK